MPDLDADEAAETIRDLNASAGPSRLDALVDAWFVAHFNNTPLSRDTSFFNLAHAAKEDLKRRLSQEV